MIGKLLPFRRRPPVVPDMSDAALVAACTTGDPGALGALFDRYAADVYRFLGRLRGADARDVDDLLQVTFLEAGRVAGSFRGGASVRTWIFAIAANVVRHHARGEGRRRTVMDSFSALPQTRVESPADAAERRQLIERLAGALDDLDEDLRVAFVMCDLEEIPGVEAARALGLRPGTMWRRLHDARRRLRHAIEKEIP